MAQSRVYKGVGTLLVLGERFDEIPYRFEARLIQNRLSADGVLTMKSIPDIMKAFTANGVILQLETGETVDVVLTEMTIQDLPPSSQIVISGPVPGFP